MSTTSTRRGGHAVVIGASMGGLVAAAAVAPFYNRVTIVDRDELPDTPQHRRGVPQSKHAHGLQPGGLMALDNLFPGLVNELDRHGTPGGDIAGQAGWYIGDGVLARTIGGVLGLGVTRPFLEHTVRMRVRALPNVQVRDDSEAVALVADGDRIVGIDVAPARGRGAAEQLDADLVIDASGRVSKLPEWLTAMGWEAPVEEQVHCRMAYLTRRWQLTNEVMDDDILQVIAPGETPHFGVIIAQEDGSHIVTIGGLMDQGPEKDDDAYLAFARNLPYGRIADALDGAKPLTDLQPSHFPYSRRRRYDKLAKFPSGLIALGDSIASFNPMYGQGMTVAALEAVALRDMLARGPINARKFHKKAHRVEDVAWKISTGGDLRFDGIEGKRTPDMKVMNAYLDRLTLTARTDPTVALQFLKVAGFIDPPQSMFKPAIVRRVIRGSRAAKRAAVQPQTAPAAARVA